MTTITQEAATDGQLKSVLRKGTDATEKAIRKYFEAGVSKKGAQRVDESPEFVARIHAATVLALAELSATDKYKNEEVASTFGYLSGYTKPKPVADQLKILREYFPELPSGDLSPIECSMEGAEGIFVIPHWSLVAKTYPEAVQKVLDALKKQRKGKFYNYRSGEIDADHIRETPQKIAAMQQLRDAQKSDLLQVPAQFGIRHRGRSVRRAREVFAIAEFGLGAWEIGVMLLSHPERLSNYDDLWIDCAGDEWKWTGDSEFLYAPVFRFGGGGLGFDAGGVGAAGRDYGSSSGFVPQ